MQVAASVRSGVVAKRPDNTSYAFYARMTSWLGFPGLGFGVVFPLAVMGCAATLVRLRDGEGDDGQRAVHATLGLVMLGLVASLTLIHPVARFRLYLVPLLVWYAGVGAASAVAWLRGRRAREAAGLLAAGLAAVLFQVSASGDSRVTRPRTVDYTFASRLALRDADFATARALAGDAAELFPGKGSYFANLAHVLEARGDHAAALADYERAFEMEPELPGLVEALAEARGRAPGAD